MTMHRYPSLAALGGFAALALLPLTALAQTATETQALQPEEATGRARNEAVRAETMMVVAANPLAAEAGFRMLKEGGSAVDAMIATQLVLNLVEPQSSGIGGGAFLVYYDSESGETVTYDGRETAPLEAGPDLFLSDTGEALSFWDAVVGGLSVGTPGTVRLLAAAHADHGILEWSRLFQPAIELAENGFEVSPRLAGLLSGDSAERLRTYPRARDYFFPGGEPLQVGDTLKNPEFAETLRAIAEGGAAAFYTGPIAEDIVNTVRNAEGNPGLMALEDLERYKVVERPPVCALYRSYDVCGMGPPSSGGLTVGLTLGILNHFDMAGFGPDTVDGWHLFAEASKLAYADRDLYMADSDFVRMPTAGLLDPAYLTVRAQLVSLDSAQETPVAAGNPPWTDAVRYGADASHEQPGTSHIAIVDAGGDVLSMTTTIESGFGSNLMVRGFLLNNELTDFSFEPVNDGRPVANRVEPGKRPRSSMAPTIVFDQAGEPFLAIGSPGGSRIIPYVAGTIIGVIDWDLNVQEAINLGHVTNRNGDTDLEAGTEAEALAEGLTARGHTINVRDLTSGLHGIQFMEDGTLLGGADPRREGLAIGE